MEETAISQLPSVTTPQIGAYVPLVQDNITWKATLGQLAEATAFQDLVTRVATTGTLTAVYNNGSSGIEATLTNSTTLAAIAIDGVSLSLADRVLVKNQASTFQNGIYYVSVVGDGSTAWVLTRATDYDYAPYIDAGDSVTIAFGTVNAKTQWIQTETVATLGTDAIVFESNVVAGNSLTKTNNTLALSTTPTLGAASATSLTFSSTSGIIGTTTNDNAAAGSVGEYISSSVALGSAVSLVTDTPKTITSISLTAGDWDVQGAVSYDTAAGTVLVYVSQGISLTTNTLPAQNLYSLVPSSNLGDTIQQTHVVPTQRISLASTTTVYLVGNGSFSVSTLTGFGTISARRRR